MSEKGSLGFNLRGWGMTVSQIIRELGTISPWGAAIETAKTCDAGMIFQPLPEAPFEEPPKAVGDDGEHQNDGY